MDTRSDLDRVSEECSFVRAKADEYSQELKETIVQEQKWELAVEYHTRKLYRSAFLRFRRGVLHAKVFISHLHLLVFPPCWQCNNLFPAPLRGSYAMCCCPVMNCQLLRRAAENAERQRTRSLMQVVFFEWRQYAEIARVTQQNQNSRLLETFARCVQLCVGVCVSSSLWRWVGRS